MDRPTPVTFRGGFALIWRVVNAVRGTRLFLWVWVIFGFWTFFLISEFLDAISYDFCSEFRVMVTGGGLAGKYSPRGNFSAPHYFFFLPFRMRTTVRDGGGPRLSYGVIQPPYRFIRLRIFVGRLYALAISPNPLHLSPDLFTLQYTRKRDRRNKRLFCFAGGNRDEASSCIPAFLSASSFNNG